MAFRIGSLPIDQRLSKALKVEGKISVTFRHYEMSMSRQDLPLKFVKIVCSAPLGSDIGMERGFDI